MYNKATGVGGVEYGEFEVRVITGSRAAGFKLATLQLVELSTGATREVMHCWFDSWPDYGVPEDESAALQLLTTVQQYVATPGARRCMILHPAIATRKRRSPASHAGHPSARARARERAVTRVSPPLTSSWLLRAQV